MGFQVAKRPETRPGNPAGKLILESDMAYDVYEITVEVANGDWVSTQVNAADYDFHRAVIDGLDFAYQRRGKLVSVNKIGVARSPVRDVP